MARMHGASPKPFRPERRQHSPLLTLHQTMSCTVLQATVTTHLSVLCYDDLHCLSLTHRLSAAVTNLRSECRISYYLQDATNGWHCLLSFNCLALYAFHS